MALQALALYSTLAFSETGSSVVVVRAPSSLRTFNINQDNKLLYQEETLHDLEGTISLEAQGSMCASIQVQDHQRSTQTFQTRFYLPPNSPLDFFFPRFLFTTTSQRLPGSTVSP